MNAKIIEQFKELVTQIRSEMLNAQLENDLKAVSVDKHRLKSIQNVLRIIKRLDFEITNADDLKGIPGIGPGSLRRINEILETGYLSELATKYAGTKQKKISGIQELEKVIGIGDALAKKLVIQHKITSIDALKKAIKNGKIDVSDKIKLGLKYYGIVEGNIPRKETSQIEKYLQKKATKIDSKLIIMICGSYRRGKKTSNDVDVLMYHPDLKSTKDIQKQKLTYLEQFVNELTKEGFLLDHMTDKNYKMKYMGFSKYKDYPVRRIDIRFIPFDSRFTAMLYFTGPFELNTEMRRRAEKRKMMLNEYGLYKLDEHENKTLVSIKSEADVFEKLDMKYLTPEEREQYSTGKLKKIKE